MCFKKNSLGYYLEQQQNIFSLINEETEILTIIVASITTVREKITQQKK